MYYFFWSKEIKLKSKTELLIGANPGPEMKQRNLLIVLGTGDGEGASNVVGRGVYTISNAVDDHSIDSVLDHEYSTDNGGTLCLQTGLNVCTYVSHLFSLLLLLWMIKSILDIYFIC